MVLYLDLVFLLNFFINFFLLSLIEIIQKDKIKYLNITLASIIGGCTIVAYCFDRLIFTLFQIFGGILIALVAYYHNSPRKIIIKIASFYLINFALIGLLSVFNIRSFALLGLSLFAIMIIIFFEAQKRYYLFLNSNKYKVNIMFNNYSIDILGFLDTGNLALSIDNTPIIFIDSKYYSNDLIPTKELVINTINGREIVLAYQPTSFYLKVGNKKEYKDVLIVFTKVQEDFECLLNAWLFI